MPNTTVPAAGEAMPTPSIYSLLAAYWQAQDELSIAMAATDREPTGSPEESAAFEVQFAVGDRAHEALLDICKFVPQLRFEAGIKNAFLVMAFKEGSLDSDAIEAILSATADCVQFKRPVSEVAA